MPEHANITGYIPETIERSLNNMHTIVKLHENDNFTRWGHQDGSSFKKG